MHSKHGFPGREAWKANSGPPERPSMLSRETLSRIRSRLRPRPARYPGREPHAWLLVTLREILKVEFSGWGWW